MSRGEEEGEMSYSGNKGEQEWESQGVFHSLETR